MAFVSGFLNIGTALVSGAVVPPPTGTNYNAVPILFNAVSGGITYNAAAATFGPVSGAAGAPWGTLTVFDITDLSGNVAWNGTLVSPLTPPSGVLVQAPIGTIALTLNQQIAISDLISQIESLNVFATAPTVDFYTASGTSLVTAVPITGSNNIITSVTMSGAVSGGVRLMSVTGNYVQVVTNWDTTHYLNIYPSNVSGIINNLASGAATQLSPNGGSSRFATSGTGIWYAT